MRPLASARHMSLVEKKKAEYDPKSNFSQEYYAVRLFFAKVQDDFTTARGHC